MNPKAWYWNRLLRAAVVLAVLGALPNVARAQNVNLSVYSWIGEQDEQTGVMPIHAEATAYSGDSTPLEVRVDINAPGNNLLTSQVGFGIGWAFASASSNLHPDSSDYGTYPNVGAVWWYNEGIPEHIGCQPASVVIWTYVAPYLRWQCAPNNICQYQRYNCSIFCTQESFAWPNVGMWIAVKGFAIIGYCSPGWKTGTNQQPPCDFLGTGTYPG